MPVQDLQIWQQVLLSGVQSQVLRVPQLACRYTWLPLWVLNGDEKGLGSDGPSSSEAAESSVVTVLVQWQELWRLSDLEQPPWDAAALSNATSQKAA